MDRGAWRATVHGVTESRTRLSDFTVLYCTVLWLEYLPALTLPDCHSQGTLHVGTVVLFLVPQP